MNLIFCQFFYHSLVKSDSFGSKFKSPLHPISTVFHTLQLIFFFFLLVSKQKLQDTARRGDIGDAAQRGDTNEVKSLLKSGVSINVTNKVSHI